MSLVISLTCAFLATLLQQWARRYLKVTHSRLSPDKRARIRAFFAEGVDKHLLPVAVEILPALLHISLFLFFAGLVVFLSNVNLTIFKLVLSWVGVCVALYGCFTVMPIIRHDSPYYTSLSSSAWPIVTGFACFTTGVGAFLLFYVVRWRRGGMWLGEFAGQCYDLLSHGMQKTVDEAALKSSSKIVNRAFMWTFESLDEDHELERFFSGLPGFCSSKVVGDPLPRLTEIEQQKLCDALIGLLDRTFASDLLCAPVKARRAIICAKAANPHLPDTFDILTKISSNYQYTGPVVSEIVQILTGWGNNIDDGILDSRIAIYDLITNVQLHDDSWFILVFNTLGIPKAVLRDYAAHGDSLSLAILMHITRLQFTQFEKSFWHKYYRFSLILKAASLFNVQDTSPELQHEFCALWNQIIRKAQNDNNESMAFYTLRPIRNVYISLHHNTDSAPTRHFAFADDDDIILLYPPSYPVCNVAGHQSHSIPHTHDDSTSTAFVRAVPRDHHNTALDPSLPSPSLPPSSRHAPLGVDETLTDASLLDHKMSVRASLQPIGRTTSENCHIPTTLPNPFTNHATQGSIDTPPGTTHTSTMEPLALTPPREKVSPPEAITAEYPAVSRIASDDPVVSSPPPFALVFDNVLPTGPLMSSDSPVTRSDHTFSSPESHSSMLTPTVPSPSCSSPSSAPDLSAAVEGEGSATAALSMEKDGLYPSSIHEDIMATPDLPQESTSRPPIIASLSCSSLDAVHGRPSSTPFAKPE